MPPTYVLELGTGDELQSPNVATIATALRKLLAHEDSFAIMMRPSGGEEYYMQTFGTPGLGWILEHREGGETQHFSAGGDAISVERVAAALYAYGTGDLSWRTAFPWERVDMRQAECTPDGEQQLDRMLGDIGPDDEPDETPIEPFVLARKASVHTSEDAHSGDIARVIDDEGVTSALTRQGNAIDYLATPAVAAYFDAREHEAYYRALKRVGLRRDFHEKLIAALARFVELTETASGAAVVNLAMEGHRRSVSGGVGNALENARAQSPRGVALLGLLEPLTYESLKVAYRAAARRHHPDAGGDHNAMVAVNEAFGLVHALLREERLACGEDEPGLQVEELLEPTDCADYRYVCAELLFRVTLDDWNIEVAAEWLERIVSPAWQQSRYARNRHRQLALTEPAGRLATRLAIARRTTEAQRVLTIAEASLAIARAEGLSLEHCVREPKVVLAGTKKSQVVINHPRQAEHALKLGVIDQKRYRKALEKFAAEALEQSAAEQQLRAIQTEASFLRDLPTDRVARGKVVRRGLVPEPGYYVSRIAQLTDDQQAEYLRAFDRDAPLPLVRKYTFVRLVSLLESVLFYPDDVDAAAAAHEAGVLGALHDGTGGAYATDVAAAIRELTGQPAGDRRERAALLMAIERDSFRSPADIRIQIGGMSVSPIGVPLTADYMKLIMRSIRDLRFLQQRGTLPEEHYEQEA